jgi:CTP synthase
MSREFDPDPQHAVIEMMNEQREITQLGGTMRLGAFPCVLDAHSLVRRIYGADEVSERHRHRYEVNPAYHAKLNGDLAITGWSPDRKLAEMVEHRSHPFFVGCQFHPEFKSKPLAPHPLFAAFAKAALVYKVDSAKNS